VDHQLGAELEVALEVAADDERDGVVPPAHQLGPLLLSSNLDEQGGRNFDPYTINVEGSGLDRVTFNSALDGFPMFSPDGKKIVFCSNRNQAKQGDTNVFIADWVE
jgi:hypothetical protein